MPKIILDTVTNISDTSIIDDTSTVEPTPTPVNEPQQVDVGTIVRAIGELDVSPMTVTVKPSLNRSKDDKYRKVRRTNFQARLGRKLDKINGRIIDNDIRLTAHPTDMIRVEAIRDARSQDLISRVIKSTEIMPILLPKMVDIPMRHLVRESKDVLIPSLYSIAQEEYFEVYAPVECDLNEDDLLMRILYDSSPEIDNPYVLVFQVKEVLGTFGYSSLLWKKCLVTIYDEALPDQVVNTVRQFIKKRESLDW